MDELTPIETRSRSRSKTPFLRSSCDRELCTHLGDHDDPEHPHYHHKKIPTMNTKHKQITTIIEEEVESVRPKSPTKRQAIKTTNKTTTSDYLSNSNVNLSTNRDSNISAISSNTFLNNEKSSNSSSVTTTKTTKITRQLISNGRTSTALSDKKSKEILQNESNSEFEENYKIKTSTPIMNINHHISQRNKSQNVENSYKDDSDTSNPAYQEYIKAGEYWKKYPKTDYTYSKLSPHRRELAPGIVAFPNMSRRSLEKYSERVNVMLQRNPEQAESIRKRFIQTLFTRNSRSETNTEYDNHLLYDSQDETDFNGNENYTNIEQTESLFRRFITRIISLFTIITSVFRRKEEKWDKTHLSRTGIHYSENRGIFSRIKSGISNFLFSIFKSIYIVISTILYFDVWLLRSTNPDGRKKKGFILFLLILLPFLLLAAWKLLDENEQHQILSRYNSLIPFTLIGIRNSFYNFKDTMSNLNFGFNWLALPRIQLSDTENEYSTVASNIQKSLSEEEYENLINHIQMYVSKTVDNKINLEWNKRSESISPELSSIIANLIQEELSLHLKIDHANSMQSYKLTDEDIELIIEKLKLKLINFNYPGPIVFSTENINEISKLIQQKIEKNNIDFNIYEKIDLEEILSKILMSPALIELIDSRITSGKYVEEKIISKFEAGLQMSAEDKDVLKKQQEIIEQLNNEIIFMKTNLAEKLNENDNLHNSVLLLQNAQTELTERLKLHEINVNGRFDSLLAEIDYRLAGLNQKQFESINNQIKLNLLEILGYTSNNSEKNDLRLDEVDIKNWIRNMFVAKAILEQRLNELNIKLNGNIKDEIEKSGALLFNDISTKLKEEILNIIENRQKEIEMKYIKVSSDINFNRKHTELDEKEIKRIVRDVLAVYDADKTGMVDFALESAGGQVLSTRCTENYHIKSAQISLFGFPLWYPSNTPRTAISPSVQPGECWAFRGFPGFLVLKLNTMIFVSGFSLEHIPKSLAPSGNIDSAPRNFTVWGLDRENDENPVLFGEYEYSDESTSIQYFAVQNKNIIRPFDIVELRIETNHGNLGYTCLYRFRVHGKAANVEDISKG